MVYLAGSSDLPAFERDFYSEHLLQHSLRRFPDTGTGRRKGETQTQTTTSISKKKRTKATTTTTTNNKSEARAQPNEYFEDFLNPDPRVLRSWLVKSNSNYPCVRSQHYVRSVSGRFCDRRKGKAEERLSRFLRQTGNVRISRKKKDENSILLVDKQNK